MKAITIKLGYIGPTDACLVIADGIVNKEFCIESPSWLKVETIMEGADLPIITHPDDFHYAELSSLLYQDTSDDER